MYFIFFLCYIQIPIQVCFARHLAVAPGLMSRNILVGQAAGG